MKSDSRRKRHRILAFVAAGAVSLVVVLVLLFTVNSLRGPRHLDESPSQRPTQPNAQPTSPTRPKKPRPEFQDASCPDVQVVSVPGSWESSPQQDPLNPVQFPNALLLNVTGPLTGQFDPSRLQTYTVPYTAEFHKPFSEDDNISYDASRREGFDATWKALEDMTARCPLTSYVLVGFSQGAVIAGDIASEIGNGRGPVDEDLVLGVTLIADGRREANVGQDLDQNPPGEGAEITLQHVPLLSGDTLKPFGITMTGPRDGGFGTLDNRTFQICAEGDLICAAPVEAFDIGRLPATIDALTGGAAAPVHALYNTTQFWSADGQPATVWARNWAAEVIAGAPRPKRG